MKRSEHESGGGGKRRREGGGGDDDGDRRRESDSKRERERDGSRSHKSEGDRRRERSLEDRRESGREERRERGRERESGRDERRERGSERESGREERGREEKRESGREERKESGREERKESGREERSESYQSVHAPVARKVELLEVAQGSKGELASGYKGMDCKVMTMGYERAWGLDTNTSKGVVLEGGICERAEAAGKRGTGSVRGGRGGRVLDRETRQKYAKEGFDLVDSRGRAEDGLPLGKKAGLLNSQPIRLQANFFKVESRPNWRLFHYDVGFTPVELEFDTRLKKALFRKHSVALGANIFDGSSLYTSNAISQDALILKSTRESDRKEFTLTIKLVGELAPTDVTYLQLYNIFVRRALEMMKLEEMGRNFYDYTKAISIHAHHLQLWPGFKTCMRNYEHDILLQVEITHKVLRLDNCLQVMKNMTNQHNEYDKERIRNALVGTVVMTIYNRKTYRVDDIDWEITPTSSFDKKNGQMITYLDYFKSRYGKDIQDTRQPLLVSRATKKDLHRGFAGKILLIPELCQRTGLSDEMRANNQLMRALATHLHTGPDTRIAKLTDFMRKMKTTPEVVEDFRRWGLQFNSRLVEVDGRIIPNERIFFANDTFEMPTDRYDWNNAFRTKPMYSSVPLKTWVVITTSSSAWCVDKLVNNMQRVSRPLNFLIANPIALHRITGERPSDFAKAVDDVMNEYKRRVQLLFVILPRQVVDTYTAVKKRTLVEFGVPSQCFVATKAQNDKGLMSICTKVVVQMNAKLGGEPWKIHIPLKSLMVVGFDVHHCGKRKGSSVGALVATTSATFGKYFSTTSSHSSRNEVSDKMGVDFIKCLHAYQKVNNCLPDRIIMYRDGVGEGQLSYVYNTELKSIRDAIYSVYKSAGRENSQPKFSFIVVTKRINTRLFASDPIGKSINPGPGTVVDDVITFPERYDFYLISCAVRQGTVSPVSYNILYDTQELTPDRMQRLTFKLTHLYFNWSGSVAVPAPCQYASKLAYLTGVSLGGEAHEKLSNSLYFL